uniref:type I protein arginine methyltransferase n=1 Tax=Oryza meridionalis TaxID=40149 RepID=A0A0E0EG11_9ORYZ
MASPDLFPNVSFAHVSADASTEATGGATAVFGGDASTGAPRLSLVWSGETQAKHTLEIDLSDAQIFKLGPTEWLCVSGESEAKDGVEEKSYSRAIKVVLRTEAESKAFYLAFQQWKHRVISGKAGEPLENGLIIGSKSKFDTKIEASSAKMYFHYYGQLLHQQNMLQDFVRTGTYYAAVMENRSDFEGRVVVDVGAGSGILSLFAAQAGARHVYAVEASEMAEHAQRLISGNPSLGQRITVIKGKVEEVELPEKADILISEPMGTLLVNERMLESYVIARDRFLVPGGKMFPTTGRIHMAPFSDEYLYVEMANKALFWQQHNFFGVDLTPLHGSAFQGYFSQPVVDAFDPRLLVSPPTFHTLDFTTMKEEELYEIDIPLNFVASVGTRHCPEVAYHCSRLPYDSLVSTTMHTFTAIICHGRTRNNRTTSSGSPQCTKLHDILDDVSFFFPSIALEADGSCSFGYFLEAKMWGEGAEQGGILQTSTAKLELKEPYYRLSQPQPYVMQQDQQQQQLPSLQPQGSEQQMQDGLSPSITIEPDQDSAAFTR